MNYYLNEALKYERLHEAKLQEKVNHENDEINAALKESYLREDFEGYTILSPEELVYNLGSWYDPDAENNEIMKDLVKQILSDIQLRYGSDYAQHTEEFSDLATREINAYYERLTSKVNRILENGYESALNFVDLY